MGGRKLNDHSSWVGKGSDGTVFPKGSKVQKVNSEEGAGSLMHYEDNNEAIVKTQGHQVAKLKSHPLKTGYRN